MKLKTISAAAVLAVSSLAASATTIDLGLLDSSGPDTSSGLSAKFAVNASIADTWTFTLDKASLVSFGAQQSFSSLSSAIHNFSGVLVGYGPLNLTSTGTQANLSWSGSLLAGTYSVNITGLSVAKNTQYTSTLSATPAPATPVPEPETYALLLAGLGVVGFMASRRKQG
ncbi:FxDxF family PEP-CTERM protein [Paucibacter sp. KBW04]|uniref:FxDxF family PEP-CTERM protein n=1 Tax=Paucibacter sp. KBW04 TaxID=2153361 RepID=UPI0018CC270E|nr:FxDxF family PEP-CTERM protein [Paucibacter sp. KBW04]